MPEVEAHVDVPRVEVELPEAQVDVGMPKADVIGDIFSGNLFVDSKLNGFTGGICSSPDVVISPVVQKLNFTSSMPSPNLADALRQSSFPCDNNSFSDVTVSEQESSSHSGSLQISPRDFYVHSATPEFKRPLGVETINEESSVTAEKKKERNVLNWFYPSWRGTGRRRSGVSTSSGVEDGRSPSTTVGRKPKLAKPKKPTSTSTTFTATTSGVVEDEDLGLQADVVPNVQLSSAPLLKSEYHQSEVKNFEPALPRDVEYLWTQQKAAESSSKVPKSRGSKSLFPKKVKSKKKSAKVNNIDQSVLKDESDVSTPRLRKPSSSLSGEPLQRQTWHHPELTISPIVTASSPTPPHSPLHYQLNDEISEWLSHAYRAHYADTSPLRKPRPWSTLDFPPRNCTFLNDDYLFPYSITPTKLPSCHWKSDKEYDVPYMDDDALPLDEPEWALGESRRTLTLTSADADFWHTAIAEEEKSDASGGRFQTVSSL
ncbi:unnamed protein product [Hydatigera taeniaeformis]|uniref:PHD-type domain-containing protein n=1 Tax=Hydatigena taeniaeformis TaxID=6205 RepID=A0A0R3X842_HYDTA|nr:unnamed protein product [Hydatigera taeniaeformis]